MTTAIGNEDAFDEVERGIDWLERLENIKARQDREAAIHETVGYVSRLRAAISTLAGDATAEEIAELHGGEIAELVRGIRNGGTDDPWTEYLSPALQEQ